MFGSRERFVGPFIGHLVELSLAENDFASRVLVLANTTYDDKILDYFGNCRLEKMIERCLTEGDRESAREEDINIIEWANNNLVETITPIPPRVVGELVVSYNLIRTKRPQGKAANPAFIIFEPFIKSIFLLPGLQRESFAETETACKPVQVFYNKYPFNLFHSILFPDIEKCLPQFLTREYHEWVWNTMIETVENIPEFSIGYNSLGAFASQNHLHFQLALCKYPVTSQVWKHNGNENGLSYLAFVSVFDSLEDSWEWINKANRTNTAYNLLYANGKVYCFARRMQRSYEHEAWTSGFAFAEMSGWIIVGATQISPSDQELETICTEFNKVTLELK